jgi:putative cardiolipin synthase
MRLANTICLIFCLLLTACASLPEDYPRTASWKLEAGDSALATAFEPALAAHPGQSGAYPLSLGVEALAARVALARAAQVSLDVQYYIWHGDAAGWLLLKELLDAADRGVRVRLLLDDLGVGARDDSLFLLLDAHPKLSVALFNPIASRKSRTLGLLGDPLRLNNRMHNKSMTADSTLTVVGGRNIGNEYFALNDDFNFADLDVLALGAVASDVSDSFDQYWNSEATIPISAFHAQGASQDQLAKARQQLDAHLREAAAPYYAAMRETPLIQDVLAGNVTFFWGRITALHDAPEKSLGDNEAVRLLLQLGDAAGQAQTELLIISPYFVPGKLGAQKLVEAAQRGVRVRIATNSLAATDVGAVHAGYKKYRRTLLEGGVELYELMPALNAGQQAISNFSMSGSSAASLHAKTFVFDRQQTFIGSMNLDGRSVDINTEMGLLIDNPELAELIVSQLEQSYRNSFYTVTLEPQNPARPGGRQQLSWVEYRDGEEIRYDHEPHTTAWQRFKVNLIGLLPIESQL